MRGCINPSIALINELLKELLNVHVVSFFSQYGQYLPLLINYCEWLSVRVIAHYRAEIIC